MSRTPEGLERQRAALVHRGAPRAGECCDLCGVPLDDRHAHLVDLETGCLCCVCRPCTLLFTSPAAGERYCAVPEHAEPLELTLDDSACQRLQLPAGIAFFLRSTVAGRAVVFLPGPRGATQSLLPLEEWESLAMRHPRLARLVPDLEALLVRRREGTTCDGFIVPIDRCYELVGRMRRQWRGRDGGAEVDGEIDRFFASLALETGAIARTTTPSLDGDPSPPIS